MRTIAEKPFDYQQYLKQTPPDSSRIHRGTEARNRRLAAAIQKISVAIDPNLMEQFAVLAPERKECENLIHRALREWLSARRVKELVQTELQQVLRGHYPLIGRRWKV